MTVSRKTRIVVATASAALGLVVAEGALRVVERGEAAANPGVAFLACDAELGWSGVPHDAFDVDMPNGRHRITRNALGMNDVEHGPKRAAGKRVLFLGDSFVEALQVPLGKAHHRLAEGLLAERNPGGPAGPRVEVVAAGIGGWSLAQALLFFERERARLEPDIVVAFWFPGNDLSDVLPTRRYQTCRGRNCFAPYFAPPAGALEKTPWLSAPGAPLGIGGDRTHRKVQARALSAMYFGSALWRRLSPLFPPRYPGYRVTESAFYEETASYEEGVAWSLTEALFDRLRASAAPARLVVVLVPHRSSVERRLAGISTPRHPARGLAQRLEALGIPYIDLEPVFTAHLQAGGDAPYWPDGHWTATGNRLAAEAEARFLAPFLE